MQNKEQAIVVLPGFHVGGAEKWAVNVAGALQESGLNVTILSLGPVTASPEIFGVQIPLVRLSPLRALVLLAFRRQNLAVCVAALTRANLFVGLCCWILRIPNITSLHLSLAQNPAESRMRWLLRNLVHRFLWRVTDRVVACSQGVARQGVEVLGCPQALMTTIYNPCFRSDEIRRPRSVRRQTGAISIVAAGRLHPQKGFDILLQAVAQSRLRSRCKVAIYGDGPERSHLERQRDALGLAETVELPGFTSNLRDRFRDADVFVLSSRYEGFGNVLAEALAAGCLCISFDVPFGPDEILQDGRFGILVPDVAPTPLAAAIIQAVDAVQSGHSILFKDAGFEAHVSQFTNEVFRLRFLDVVATVTDGRR
jgi:glycosyltransferase involved in cell wall biosynthesis